MQHYYSVVIAIIVGIIGAVLFKHATNPNTKEMGRIAFFCGLLVTLIRAGVAAFIVT